MNHPKVCIIILNWNGVDDTIECLESLAKITYPNYEVVVVDNASEGDDVRILRQKFGDYIHVIENDKNYGFSEGNNIGMRHALANLGPDYCLFLNNDTVVHADFLDEMITVAAADRRIGIVGPKIYYYDDPERIWFAGGSINYWTGRTPNIGKGQIDSARFNRTKDVDFITGCCMLVSRNALSTVGLFDSAFFFGNEDFDLSIRAVMSGFRVMFVPEARVWHKAGASTGSAGKRTSPLVRYYDVKDHFVLMQKHWSKLQFASSTLWFVASLPWLFVNYLYYDRSWSTLKHYVLGLLHYLGRK